MTEQWRRFGDAVKQYSADELARMAQRALLYEVVVHPKPGLVDPIDSGSHRDMDVFTFIDSTVSLTDYFQQAACAGRYFTGDDLRDLFARLRELGIQAERTMFAATGGVNTHKGAVFSLGVAVGASGWWCRSHKYSTDGVRRTICGMLRGLTAHDFKRATDGGADRPATAGEQQFLVYGRTGIRGEAEQGFPAVIEHALPYLRGSAGPLNVRLLDTLMVLAAVTEDSNLIKRAGGVEVLDWMRGRVKAFFEQGGAGTHEGMAFLEELNAEFVERHLSLGGCADLLILTIFFGLMEGVIGGPDV